MRKELFICSIIISSIVLMVACTETKSKEPSEPTVISQDSLIKRGEYLVTVMGCDDCHSPKKMGPMGPEIIPELRLSGYPAKRPIAPVNTSVLDNGWSLMGMDLTSAVGPWGMSFAANLTSDETGLGNWSLSNFSTAIRKGKYKGMENGRDLLPPMPWFAYKNLSDDDLASIFAYLKSTNPVANVVPGPKPLSELK